LTTYTVVKAASSRETRRAARGEAALRIDRPELDRRIAGMLERLKGPVA
jgi:hypothetical protein